MKNNQEKQSLDKISKLVLMIAIVLICFAFFAPYLFAHFLILDFSHTGQIGDTIGGIMTPFIALAGIGLTFLAFYMQFIANRTLKEDLEEQKKQFSKTQFENQYYEMLKIHNENVKELFIVGIPESRGRKFFDFILAEFETCYFVVCGSEEKIENLQMRAKIRIAYQIFFYGLNHFFDENGTKPNSNNIGQACRDLDAVSRKTLNAPY